MFLNNDAKIILLSGVNKVADFVSATMGPGGKFINIKNGNNNHMTAPTWNTNITKNACCFCKPCSISKFGNQLIKI